MTSISVPHFIYGPTPKKGYSKRAVSPDIFPEEYERLLGCYIPFDPAYLRADDVNEKEARAIVSIPSADCVYFSRIFRRHKLDEKNRTGILTHTIQVPRTVLSEGLSYKDIERSLIEFENTNGIPVGEIPKLEISWTEDGTSSEISQSRALISRDSLDRLANAYGNDPNAKIFLTCKGTHYSERAQLGYALSRFIDLKLKIAPISIMTEPPLSLNNAYFNLIVSNIPIHIPPRIGWRPIDAKGSSSGIDSKGAVGKEGIKKALDELYR